MKKIFLVAVGVFVANFACWSHSRIFITSEDTVQIRISPKYGYDYVPDVSYKQVEESLEKFESDIPLNYNTKVKSFVDYFTVLDRNYTRMIVQRTNLYFPLFEKYLKKYNLPDELKYLSIVESGLNPKAISRVGASGLWQFMGATGRMYQLHYDPFIDERMDPEKATEAACKYLKQLYGMFGDWELALASYNAGPGNVSKARRKSGKSTFWEMWDHLPRETRSYVPQFVAIIYVMNHLHNHNLLPDDTQEYALEYEKLHIDKAIDLQALADNLNICIEDLQRLNPEVKRTFIPVRTTGYSLRIPADKHEILIANRSAILDSSAKVSDAQIEVLAKSISNEAPYNQHKIVYKVKSGDALGRIASKHHVSLADLKKWNHLRSNVIKTGQNLTIYTKNAPASAKGEIAKSSTTKPSSSPAGKIYYVQPGDTLWDISKRYEGLTIEKIKQLNNLKNNEIKVGQKLVLG